MVRVMSLGMLALGCQFGSTGNTASGGMPGGGSTAGDDGAPTGGPVDDGPGSGSLDGAPTSADDGATTITDDDGPDPGDSGDSTGTPPLEPAPWWNDAWSHRRELVIEETADGPLPVGYTVQRDKLETQRLVDAGLLRADLEDLRIVRWDGSTSTELTRRLQRAAAGQQRVWWKTRAEIDGGTKNEYWMYWGNPEADPAPAAWADSMAGTSDVYLAGEDFEDHLTGQCPDGWEACAPQWSVQSLGNGQVLRGTSPAFAVLRANLQPPDDVIVHARVRNANPGGCPGLVTHASATSGVWAGYGCESGATPVPGVSLQLATDGSFTTLVGGQAATDGEWRSIEVAWVDTQVSLHQDGVLIGTGDGSAAPSGALGLSVVNNLPGDFDDVFVRLYVDPEPTVALGAEELAP